MIDYEAKARELRKEHQKTCSDEQLVIRYGLRSAEEAQRLLDARFDERCAAALREADEAGAARGAAAEREACIEAVESVAAYSDDGQYALGEAVAKLRARGAK